MLKQILEEIKTIPEEIIKKQIENINKICNFNIKRYEVIENSQFFCDIILETQWGFTEEELDKCQDKINIKFNKGTPYYIRFNSEISEKILKKLKKLKNKDLDKLLLLVIEKDKP